MSGTTKTFLLLGAIAVGAYFLLKKAGGGSGSGAALQPAAVKPGEQVRAATYRQLRARREGMTYVPVSKGDIGAEITFTPTNGGTFTRNVVKEGTQLWAEMA